MRHSGKEQHVSDALATGLAASANEPTADSSTPDTVLDAAFAESPALAASAEPPTSPEPAKEPVAATSQPQEPTTSELGKKGEPPPERWDSILANARTKAREDALAEHRDALEIVKNLRENFTGTLAQMLEEGAADPRFSQEITAKAAAILSARRQQAKADDMPQPDQGDDKYVWYSPDQQAKLDAWKARQLKSELLNEFKPLMDLRQQIESSKQQAQERHQALSIAEERGALWKAMPHFSDHKDAILQRQAALYAEMEQQAQQGQRRLDPVNAPWEALQRAYAEVVTSQALPKLQVQQTNTLVASAAHKRAGSASDPAASAPAQPRQPRTPDEALDQVFGAVNVR